jgi:hypothetical protein
MNQGILLRFFVSGGADEAAGFVTGKAGNCPPQAGHSDISLETCAPQCMQNTTVLLPCCYLDLLRLTRTIPHYLKSRFKFIHELAFGERSSWPGRINPRLARSSAAEPWPQREWFCRRPPAPRGRRTCGRANPCLDLRRQLAPAVVAGHGFDPGVGDADDGFSEILAGESDAFQHGAGRRAVTALRDGGTAQRHAFRVADGRRVRCRQPAGERTSAGS